MKVKFVPQNQEFDIRPGQTVLDLAHEKGLYIKSICNGLPSCAECRVRLTEGESNVLPPSVKELNLIGTGYFIDQRRLACQLVCFGDVTVDLSEQIEKEKQGPRRLLGNRKIEASNAVSGNLIEQDDELKRMTTANVVEPSRSPTQPNPPSRPRPHQPQQQRQTQQRQSQQKQPQQRANQKSFRYRPNEGNKK